MLDLPSHSFISIGIIFASDRSLFVGKIIDLSGMITILTTQWQLGF
jgi:hypothetical protein